MMHRLRFGLLSLVVAMAAATALVSPPASGIGASPTLTGAANAAHPYSDPVWFPFHTPIRIGCAGSSTHNNGAACDRDHVGFYAINFLVPYDLPNGQRNLNQNPNIYSAGAGVVSKVVTGQTCNHGTTVLSGNEVRINHGGGIVAVYWHLYSVNVTVGEYVTQNTVIGRVGATGAPCINGKPGGGYLDFQVRHWGGASALTKDTPTLLGCLGATNTPAIWPRALTKDKYLYVTAPTPLPTVWTQVPDGSGIVVNPSWNCVPTTGGTGSPNAITTARMTRSSSLLHVLSWASVSKANAYTVELEVLRGSTWSVPCSPFVTPGCTSGFFLLSPSSAPHLTISGSATYRVRVSAHNGIGWSLPTGWYRTN
jgi:hypothetical protein